ncbi:MAG: D-aminoacyl-tRNA deacylase [Methanomassiliicoccales archaeon]|nr:D-aminoacyl-tRNA deacylase [Methanomassiliicoccales archaeon]
MHGITYIISAADVASMNIGNRLIEQASLSVKDEAEGYTHYSGGGCSAVAIPGIHIHAEHVDNEIARLFGLRPDILVFLSTHRSESGSPAVTLHPVGNFGEARLGGTNRLLVPSPAAYMAGRLMGLKDAFRDTKYAATFEATHHGPFVDMPAMFAEIGSDQAAWEDRDAARRLAATLLNGIDADGRVAVGVGGGHYCPRFTDLALKKQLNFSHFVPNHQLGVVDDVVADEIVRKSGGATVAVVHRSRNFAAEADRVCSLLEERGLAITDGSDAPPRNNGSRIQP